MRRILHDVWGDNLFRNSFYPLLATFVMGILGFFFWLLASRLFPPENIGLATTLIAVMNMIAFLSPLGFDSAFIRFLPHALNKNTTVNTGLIVASMASVVMSIFFLFFVKEISPSLVFIHGNIYISVLFVFFCIMTGLNALTDSVFLAYRATQYTFYINTIFMFIRLGFLALFVVQGSIGIFLAVGISQTIGLILSIVTLIKIFNYHPSFRIDYGTVTQARSYLTGNYVAGILNFLPATMVPIMITNALGPAQTAFYSIGMMIGNLLYAIPWAVSRSLFAEGSHNPNSLKKNAQKSFGAMCIVFVPAILILVFAGNHFLALFGKTYSNEGFRFLQIIAVTGVAVYALSLLETFFRVQNKPHWLIIINAVYAGTVWLVCQTLMSWGLIGIGIAWMAGYVLATCVSFFIWWNVR